MSAFTLSNLKNTAGQSRGAYGQVKRRWIHGSLKRQAILMPAMSPLMTEGTITRWKKKEGEAFAAGEVLLQIQNDFYTVDVEAQCPGILGKILMPDGTSNVPVEQVIALVAKDMGELAVLQNRSANGMPVPPPFNSLPSTPTTSSPFPSSASMPSMPSPRSYDQFKPLSSPRTPTMSPRTPSLFEKHTMGYGHRSAHIGGPRGRVPTPLDSPRFDVDVPPCPSPRVPVPESEENSATTPMTPVTAKWPQSAVDQESGQVDGAAIRRMIVSNLSSKQLNKALEYDELL
ncbi:single hybrid motif-containing protein [Agrocybe pediades]|nr:single hybrid motif-containing protein [Agrocybe pediades]